MKTILHRGDHRPDTHEPCVWSIKTMLYFRGKLGAAVSWSRSDPQALVLEADRLFGPGLIMSHEEMMKLGLTMEFRPSE